MKIINIKTYITNPGKNEIKNSAFGKNLIYKYIKKEFTKKRMVQEEILINKIYKNKT